MRKEEDKRPRMPPCRGDYALRLVRIAPILVTESKSQDVNLILVASPGSKANHTEHQSVQNQISLASRFGQGGGEGALWMRGGDQSDQHVPVNGGALQEAVKLASVVHI